MFPPRPTELAQLLLLAAIRPGDRVIDATAGNGHDTVFLAECVKDTGKVLAFDIQQKAIDSARQRVGQSGLSQRVEFFQTCHSRMEEHAEAGTVSVVMFNLGYLPGNDHGITTESGATLRAFEASARLLAPGGILSVVCYPGHETGRVESKAAEAWTTGVASSGWKVCKFAMLGTLNPAPFLLMALKSQ